MCRSLILGSVKLWLGLCTCVIFLLSITDAFADERDGQAVKYYRQGEHYFQKEKYQDALPWYEKSLEQRAQDGPVIVEERIVVRTKQYGRQASSLTQNDTLYEDYAPNRRIAEIKETLEEQERRRNPPLLALKWITLREPTHDDVLDGGETGSIVVDIQNHGRSRARDVNLTVNVRQPNGLEFQNQIPLGDIETGASLVYNVNVRAEKNAADMNRHFAIVAREYSGFDSPPLEVAFRTRPHRPPRVEITDVRVEDFDNDDVIKPQEVITVTARVKNTGAGVAEGISANVTLGENVFLGPDSEKTITLGSLHRGEFKDLRFTFLTNNRFANGERIPVAFDVNDVTGHTLARTEVPLSIQVDKSVPIIISDPPSLPLPIALHGDVDVAIPDALAKRENAIAVVIGNRDYARAGLPNVEFAQRDAASMRDYLVKTFGFTANNVIYIENATAAKFTEVFGNRENFAGKLYNFVTPEVSDVFIYYSGHGAPDLKTKGAYFVPVDADPNFIALSGYALDTFYKNIARLPARSVTVVLDTCFSGNSAGGALVSELNLPQLAVAHDAPLLERTTIFTSAGVNQVSAWYGEKRHSLFTYFFLYGLSGIADENRDGEITTAEMHGYLQKTIPAQARKLSNQEQMPLLVQKQDQVLLKYRHGGSMALR